MAWPETDWNALVTGEITVGNEKYALDIIDCGTLKVTSGQLVCCDPFAGLDKNNNLYVQIPKGEYRVVVTLADVSEALDGSHIREAYATLLIDPTKQEVKRCVLEQTANGLPSGQIIGDDEYFGFPVDAGTACFTDADSISTFMPDSLTWFEDLFENDREGSWFNLMDNPTHIRNGIANIVLPLAKRGENLVLFHSGWGDGFYPVIGGYDKDGALVNIHIDFFVASDYEA